MQKYAKARKYGGSFAENKNLGRMNGRGLIVLWEVTCLILAALEDEAPNFE